MYPQIRNLVIILSLLCFWVGCAEVQKTATDIKEGVLDTFKSDKKATPETPPAAQETTPQKPETTDTGTTKNVSSPPAKAKTKDTKATAPSKKGSQKTTSPTTEETFGPK